MSFIVICGTDGSGKGTQFTLLHKRLQKEGHNVQVADFPQYGQPSAALVEEYLNGKFGSAKDVGPHRASIFYAVDRYAASFKIRKWLREGNIVLSNRYVSANKGHQMGKIKDPNERESYLKWLNHLEYELFGIPKEDINILLYVPPEVGQQLVDKKAQRTYTEKKRDIHEADINHLREAADAYRYVAEKEGWTVINCVQDGKLMTIEEIHEKVYDVVHKQILCNTTTNQNDRT